VEFKSGVAITITFLSGTILGIRLTDGCWMSCILPYYTVHLKPIPSLNIYLYSLLHLIVVKIVSVQDLHLPIFIP
jgi:hypothetical protein